MKFLSVIKEEKKGYMTVITDVETESFSGILHVLTIEVQFGGEIRKMSIFLVMSKDNFTYTC